MAKKQHHTIAIIMEEEVPFYNQREQLETLFCFQVFLPHTTLIAEPKCAQPILTD